MEGRTGGWRESVLPSTLDYINAQEYFLRLEAGCDSVGRMLTMLALSSDPHRLCDNLCVATRACDLGNRDWRTEVPSELSVSPRFSERACLKGLRWDVVKEDTEQVALASVYMNIHACTRIQMPDIHTPLVRCMCFSCCSARAFSPSVPTCRQLHDYTCSSEIKLTL